MSRCLQSGKRSRHVPPSVHSLCMVCLVLASLLLAACDPTPQPHKTARSTAIVATPEPVYDFPAVDANYVYDQLYYLSTTFQQRESGFDLSPEQNGHKAFAHYWVQEMQRNLQGFHPQVSYDLFQGGWVSRHGDSPSYNIEITLPGAVHPDQVVVVGSHYDGMHVSQGSAFDDTSGCALMLGEAWALGTYWRTHHLYPARTLRFVLFDAEEQGLLGSNHYLNSTVNGEVSNLVAMINEEQSGLSYPVRFLGKASNPIIPLSIQQHASQGESHYAKLIQSALPVVSQEMRTLGYTSVTYHGKNGQDVNQPVFTPDQIHQLVADGGACCSDDLPFALANVHTFTLNAGDEGVAGFKTGIPDNQSYPFDTHYDTIQVLNGYANGETKKSQALVLALGFETMLQAWLFNQSDLVGTIAANQVPAGPLAAIGDVGILQPGKLLKLEAQSAFDPRAASGQLSYHWNFGDGSQADGVQVQHTYASAGKYTLTLTVQDANGPRQISQTLTVMKTPISYSDTQGVRGTALANGDYPPVPNFRLPTIIQNGDGLTNADHFPGQNG